MKIKSLKVLLLCSALSAGLLSCKKDNDANTSCDTFAAADSVCFCQKNPESGNCQSLNLKITNVTDEVVALIPYSGNGTLWCKGFTIGNVIYVIDRIAPSPQAFWKYDLDGEDKWVSLAAFPANENAYGLTGSANGKGYASQYGTNKFWEYNPTENKWNAMTDLPFTPGETHWVVYKDKYYVPNNNGIYEFNANTHTWNKFSDQKSTGFGGIFLIDADMYWFSINDNFMSHLNLETKFFETIDIQENFGSSVTFNNPFVIKGHAYIISGSNLWFFNNTSKTWTVMEEAITGKSTYTDDVFVIDGTAYMIYEGRLMVLE